MMRILKEVICLYGNMAEVKCIMLKLSSTTVIKLIDRGVAVVSVASFLSVREPRMCSSAQRAVCEISASPPVVLSLPSDVLLRYVSERKTVEPL